MDTDSNANVSSTAFGKGGRLRSCRVCRKQKLRCDGSSPCERCRISQTACIYDQRSTRKRKPGSALLDATSPSSQSQQIDTLSAQVRHLQAVVNHSQTASPKYPGQVAPQQQSTDTPTSIERVSSQLRDWQLLSPDDLEAPVTAVHVIAHPSPRGEPQRNFLGWTPSNQSKWHREEYHVSSVVERGLIDDVQARRLFANFVQHCNIATPIFDPVLDTFESISELYPLTLTVVLYLSARQESDGARLSILEVEVGQLAAKTLFENPCSIDSMEAMLLLAAHSEKTYFAVGHALQLANDLGLDQIMSRTIMDPQSCTRDDFHCARLWLFVVYFERTVALGARRIPRCNTITSAVLDRLVEHRFSHPSDIFFCGTLQLFDMSAELRHMPDSDLPSLEHLEHLRSDWATRWNAHYDKRSVHASSLQRVHLKVQMLFAKAWQLGIVLGRQLRSSSRDNNKNILILGQILATLHDLAHYLSTCAAYRRYFPWSPTCEVVMLTFTVVLGRTALSMLGADPYAHNRFKESSALVAEINRTHPCRRYSRVVDDVLESMDAPMDPNEPGTGNVHDLSWLDSDGAFFSTQIEDMFGDWASQ